jgi:hypothetical protein
MPQSTSPRVQPREDTQSPGNAVQKPVDKFRDGPVHVSIWENNGIKGAFRAASFELRYKDDKEQWQTGRSYTAATLKHLESAAREARSRIESWQQSTRGTPSPRS